MPERAIGYALLKHTPSHGSVIVSVLADLDTVAILLDSAVELSEDETDWGSRHFVAGNSMVITRS